MRVFESPRGPACINLFLNLRNLGRSELFDRLEILAFTVERFASEITDLAIRRFVRQPFADEPAFTLKVEEQLEVVHVERLPFQFFDDVESLKQGFRTGLWLKHSSLIA